ncbi:MAG: aminoacyl-tRNA hydrolase [Dehalococcoidia bacterium]|nr:aminoacyl-tRNA hydrolase [Dehalococcoidia bacterium]
MKLIIGLGNPGKSYVNNRHNVGFHCVEEFGRRYEITIRRRKARSRVGEGTVDGIRVVLAKPQTFMNLSGDAVHLLMRLYNVRLEDLLVVYDDLDLRLGRIRVREQGSSGGHKGMDSIIGRLGTQHFPRLRIGISRENSSDEGEEMPDAVSYVLGNFESEEKDAVREACAIAAGAIFSFITEGAASAMNKYN